MVVTNLKIARIRRGIPQWRLASQLGIGNTKLSMIETGRLEPTNEIKVACSRILKEPIGEIFPEQK
jgi:DNA-binding XRE family transcriptional regulator